MANHSMSSLSLCNEYLQVLVCAGGLALSPVTPQKGPLGIQISLPGTRSGDASAVSSHDLAQGGGRSLVVRHGDRITTASLRDGDPFLHLETRVENPTSEPVSIDQISIAALGFDAAEGTDAATWSTLGSGGMKPANQPLGSFGYLAVADPASRNGAICAWLTQERGLGTLLPKFQDGRLSVDAELEFGNLRVKPGQSRETDTLVVGFFPDVRLGLERFADEVAKTCEIRLKAKPSVFCTWYARRHDFDGASTEEELAKTAAFAKTHLQPFGLNVFQIDDHWQAGTEGKSPVKEGLNKGPIKTFKSTNTNYPSGMAATAANLRREGFIPGLWYMPFAAESEGAEEDFPSGIFVKDPETGSPLSNTRWSGASIDTTSPAGEAFLRDRFQRIQKWGYSYIKVDGLHLGAPSHNVYIHRTPSGKSLRAATLHDPDKTFIEAYRQGLKLLREETPGTFILGCTTTQNMVAFAPLFGMLDAMRVGPDNDRAAKGEWKSLTYGPDFAGNLWFLNNRVWHNDPDPIYVRESNPLDNVRWMASWLAISGAMNTTSERYAELPPERLDILKRTLPSHSLPARPVDVLEREKPAIWIVGNDRLHVVGLFNWDEKNPASIACDPARMGLDASKSYEVFDFWANRYLGNFKTPWSENLEGAGCRVLALRETSPHPQLLSTSRHITQGLIDVRSETWDADALTLRGSSDMVAGDPYELRIVCPPDFAPSKWTMGTPDSIASGTSIEGNLVRITVTPAKSGPVDWALTFTRTHPAGVSQRNPQVQFKGVGG